jgi:hypothetical protein
VDANSTINFAVSRATNGDYRVVALGTLTNNSTGALYGVTVTWVVTYADGTTGSPTSTVVSVGAIPAGGSAPWGEQATTGDGLVAPASVRITMISGSSTPASCVT